MTYITNIFQHSNVTSAEVMSAYQIPEKYEHWNPADTIMTDFVKHIKDLKETTVPTILYVRYDQIFPQFLNTRVPICFI